MTDTNCGKGMPFKQLTVQPGHQTAQNGLKCAILTMATTETREAGTQKSCLFSSREA